MGKIISPRASPRKLETLGKIASPKASPLTTTGSSTSLSSFLSSPGGRSRTGSKSLFSKDDNAEGLLLKFYSYDDLQLLPKTPFTDSQLDIESDLPEIIKIPIPFLRTMKLLWRRHKIFTTWRLSSNPYTVLNRRRSLVIDGKIFYSPKDTNSSTQTGNEESYVKFLLHNPDILRVQALFELEKSVDEFMEYQEIVIEDMQFRHSKNEEIALAKIRVIS